MNELAILNGKEFLKQDNRITSIQLVDIINICRKEENEEYIPLQHKNLMAKIKKEVESLENLGLGGQLNFQPSSYFNTQNKEQPCYSLNRDGALMILNSESTYVRFKTIEYINKLEQKIKPLDSYLIEDPSERARRWADERDEYLLEIESKQKQIDEQKPKVHYYDIVLNCKDAIPISVIAKDYGMTAFELNKHLKEKDIQYKCNNTWLLKKKYLGNNYTNTETVVYSDKKNIEHSTVHTKWTQKGRLFIYQVLKDDNIFPLVEIED